LGKEERGEGKHSRPALSQSFSRYFGHGGSERKQRKGKKERKGKILREGGERRRKKPPSLASSFSTLPARAIRKKKKGKREEAGREEGKTDLFFSLITLSTPDTHDNTNEGEGTLPSSSPLPESRD